MVLAFTSLSVAGFAQDEVPTKKYSVATNSFWSNWFLQVGADWNAWYSGQEHGADLKRNPFKDFRLLLDLVFVLKHKVFGVNV